MKLVYGYISFLMVLALSMLLMPMTSDNGVNNMPLLYVSGAIFWIGLIGTIVTAVIINNYRKRKFQTSQIKQLGVIHFFQNKEAMVMDVTMIVAIVGFIVAVIASGAEILQFVFMAISIFTFGMHCMLNGINYKLIKHNERR